MNNDCAEGFRKRGIVDVISDRIDLQVNSKLLYVFSRSDLDLQYRSRLPAVHSYSFVIRLSLIW